ncbi:transposase family protein [Leptospira sp. 201903074]|nr:transposase family protein [Leptospira abararensis]
MKEDRCKHGSGNPGDKKCTRKKVLDRPSKLRAIDLLNKEGISKRRSLKLLDFLHERTIDGRKARILSRVDLCTRENVVLSADYSISSVRLIRFLESLPELPKSFITDNGPEFTSRVFINWLSKNNIGIYYIYPGKPTQNAFVESFNGKLRSECLQLSFCRDLNELRNELSKFQKDYNEERLHSSLNYLTPLEFKAKYGN